MSKDLEGEYQHHGIDGHTWMERPPPIYWRCDCGARSNKLRTRIWFEGK